MSLSKQISKHFRDVYFGGNWTAVNMKNVLLDVNWQEAITKIESYNTIATLVFHTNYYVQIILNVLKGRPLEGDDKLSFNHPPINSSEDWEEMLNKSWKEAEQLSDLIEQLPEDIWENDFSDKKYGNYYRNINGMIEHTHYHLGQLVFLKKMINSKVG